MMALGLWAGMATPGAGAACNGGMYGGDGDGGSIGHGGHSTGEKIALYKMDYFSLTPFLGVKVMRLGTVMEEEVGESLSMVRVQLAIEVPPTAAST